MTAYELDDFIMAGRRRDCKNARSLELLAFNIGALVLAAVNAPGKFPRSPDEAFGREKRGERADGGKADMMAIAEQINRRLQRRKNDSR